MDLGGAADTADAPGVPAANIEQLPVFRRKYGTKPRAWFGMLVRIDGAESSSPLDISSSSSSCKWFVAVVVLLMLPPLWCPSRRRHRRPSRSDDDEAREEEKVVED
jgi:hypothetical protein